VHACEYNALIGKGRNIPILSFFIQQSPTTKHLPWPE
jgi:hypothetical protein